MKTCKICKQTKPVTEFPPAATTRDRLDIYCRECKKVAQKTWYAENRKANKIRNMLWRASKRARQKGLPFTITFEDLEPLPTHCPVLGFCLNWDRAGLPAGDSPSLDRRDNRLGYVPGNIQVISHRANMIKCDATADEIMKVALWLA